ncbi:Carbon catabolite repressor protein 4-like 2 isoform B [Glycine soja]|uniref:Carbon catabolite repressor protein 4-like 2 isoform A n=1 Tax=Glycine soja TaxID=3848 RepID=A0A445IZH0_GLYSO|nr:Carbon catabolite repressor protein 4-like 2 isoform A [Glycine soja]RZB91511.1 Carbon catabolite repressor protein 4-like 2 isoform B [Glycine soja]
MSNGKAVGPDNIPIEVWKTLGDRGLEWLTELFNEIMRSKHMPEEWRRSTLVPIYKNKGDIQNCANYRGIKLMSHTLKLWERVIERRLRKETQVTENQFGFMPGKSTMEAIYLLRRVMEQYRMVQQDLHLIFIDLEKAYDRVPREILWKALEKKGVRVAYIRAIQDMYDRVSTSVRTQGGESDDFPITIGLHQGSTLSPYLFTLILDVLTEQIQEIASRCMLFADDIVLLGESREELNERLETWRRALETHGFRLSRSKSEYMECKFNKRRRVSNSEVKIGDHIIPQVTRFKYLGSVIQDDGEIEGDVNHRIQAGWMKWRKASGVLCDAKVPIKLKGKFYRTAVRPAILYGTECWAVKSQHENKVGVAEMRMLRWMCGKTRQDKIRNEAIRERDGVAPIVEKMVENRLRWFGHVERRPVDSVVRRVDQMERRQTIRGRGKPKKTIRKVIKKDLEINGLDRSMANTHVNVSQDLKDVKLWQVHTLLKGLEKIAASADIPMLVCGDFNSVPGSAPHALLAMGKVDPSHPDLAVDPLNILRPHSKLVHQLPLVSAYTSFARTVGLGYEQHKRRLDGGTNEPLFTNVTRDFIGTLDYIFYTADSLVVESLLELLDEESLRKDTALPSPEWSSDHIALLAEFRCCKNKSRR